MFYLQRSLSFNWQCEIKCYENIQIYRLEDMQSLSRNDSEKLEESGSSADESDDENAVNDTQVCIAVM